MDEAIRAKDQQLASAVVTQFGKLGYPAKDVFAVMRKYAISEDGTLSHTGSGLKIHGAGSVEEAKALAKILHDSGYTETLNNFDAATIQRKREIANAIKDFSAGNIPEPPKIGRAHV